MKRIVPYSPFPVEAHFRSSLVLTYYIPRQCVEAMLPAVFELDLVNEDMAAIAVALVDTQSLRPAGWPSSLGRDFVLAGYRLFVRYPRAEGGVRRGLYILGSQTNKKSMKILGNSLTAYRYEYLPIRFEQEGEICTIEAADAMRIKADFSEHRFEPNAVFDSLDLAKKFAGPMPWTFSFQPEQNRVSMVRGQRSLWKPKIAKILHSDIPKLGELGLEDAVFSHAFHVHKIDYLWKKAEYEYIQ